LFAEDKTAMIAFEIPPNEEGKASNSLSSTLQLFLIDRHFLPHRAGWSSGRLLPDPTSGSQDECRNRTLSYAIIPVFLLTNYVKFLIQFEAMWIHQFKRWPEVTQNQINFLNWFMLASQFQFYGLCSSNSRAILNDALCSMWFAALIQRFPGGRRGEEDWGNLWKFQWI
jgi:hypothetical protein